MATGEPDLPPDEGESDAATVGEVVAGRFAWDGRPAAAIALSALVHAAVLAAMMFFAPSPSSLEDGEMSADTQDRLRLLLFTAVEEERAAWKVEAEAIARKRAQQGETKEGGLGDREVSLATRWPKPAWFVRSGTIPRPTRQETLLNGLDFRVTFFLETNEWTDSSPIWGHSIEPGRQWAYPIGDFLDASGLGRASLADGYGGHDERVGLFRPITMLAQRLAFEDPGAGVGSNPRGGARRTVSPRARLLPVSVSGRLPPEIVHRYTRPRHPQLLACYARGLRRNPHLQGAVSVSFVIGATGRVGSVGGGGTLPDSGVISCVAKAFEGMSFPTPEGGLVRVTYPMGFEPDE